MFDIGFTEMMLVGVIALVVLGPERLPLVARKVGRFLGHSRRMFSKFQEELSKETSALDETVQSQLSAVKSTMSELESDFEESIKKTEQEMHSVFSLENKQDETGEE